MKNILFLFLLLFSGVALAQTQGQVFSNRQRTAIGNMIADSTANFVDKTTVPYVNVKDFGAIGDGITDDTQAIQDALDYAYNDGSFRSIEIRIPSGRYKITKTLTYQGSAPNGINFQGEQGDSRGIDGTAFIWQGKPKGTMLYLVGTNGSQINNIGIEAGSIDTTAIGSLETAIWIDATNSDLTWSVVNILTFDLSSNLITITTNSAHNLLANRPVRISGVTGYNGLYLVNSVLSPTSFTISYYGDNYSTTGGTAIRVRTGGSSGVRLSHINISGVNGYDCAGIRFANGLNVGTEQVSEVYMDHILIGGTESYLGSGIKTEQGGNTTDFWFRSGTIYYFHIAVNTTSNGIVGLTDMSFSLCDTLIKSGTQNLLLSNCRAEGDMVILVGTTGANAGNVTIQNCQFNISSADTNDVMINFTGTLSLYGNQFYNTRTAYTQPKFIMGDILVNAGSGMGGFISIGNLYQNAVNYPAVYYSTNLNDGYLAFDGTYFKGTGRNVISIGDYGGTYGNLYPLKNYYPAGTISSTDSIIAQNGFIRMSENDSLSWRNHANTSNVSISKDTTDKIIIGGLEGVSISKAEITYLPTDTAGLNPNKLYTNISTGLVRITIPKNILVNGNFNNWNNFGSYRIPSNFTAPDTTMMETEESPAGTLHITSNGSGAAQIYSLVNQEIGKTYGYSFIVYEPVDSFYMYSAGDGQLITEAGNYSGEHTSTEANNILSFVALSDGRPHEITVDNIRIWEKGSTEKDSVQAIILVPDTTDITDGYTVKYVGGAVVWLPDISTSGTGTFLPDGVTIDTTAGGLARVVPSKVVLWDGVSTKQNADADLTDLADGELTASKVGGVKDADYGDITVSSGTWSVEDDSHNHTIFADTLSLSWGALDTTYAGSLTGWKAPNDITIVEISAYTDANTCTFNLEERAETTPNTAGTDVMGSDLVADTNQEETSTFTNATISKNNWLVPTISATGDVSIFTISVRYIKTD